MYKECFRVIYIAGLQRLCIKLTLILVLADIWKSTTLDWPLWGLYPTALP